MPKRKAQERGTKLDKEAEFLAKKIVRSCVRDTFLEDLHAGTTPTSKKGDYSDVKVVTPFGEIPWTELSRISDEEMKRFMKEATNKVYTLLLHIDNVDFLSLLPYPAEWDVPEVDEELNFVIKLAGKLAGLRPTE